MKNPVFKNIATVLFYKRVWCTRNWNPVFDIIFDIEWVWTREIRAGYDMGFVYGLSLCEWNKYEIEWKRFWKTWDRFKLLNAKIFTCEIIINEFNINWNGVLESKSKEVYREKFDSNEIAYKKRTLEYKFPGYKYSFEINYLIDEN